MCVIFVRSTEYTDLNQSAVTQRQSVQFGGSVNGLKLLLERIGGIGTMQAVDEPDVSKFRVFDCIDLHVEDKMLVLEWNATPVNDMFADTVMASLMQTALVGNTIKGTSGASGGGLPDRQHFRECCVEMLQDMFGEAAVSKLAVQDERLTVTVNGKRAELDMVTLAVRCEEDATLKRMVETAVEKLSQTLVQTLT